MMICVDPMRAGFVDWLFYIIQSDGNKKEHGAAMPIMRPEVPKVPLAAATC